MGYQTESVEEWKARMDMRVREIDRMIDALKDERDSITLQSYPKRLEAQKEVMDFLGFVEADLLPTNVRKDRAARLRKQYG